MDDQKHELVDFLVRCEALLFGDFVTKSGRRTPYFINAGRFRSGAHLDELGRFYARAIVERFGAEPPVDVLFGPAYKGIPLAVAAAVALRRDHGLDLGVCFDRKEVKDHGEGGSLVGHEPADGDRVLIVEDVTTAGTSIRNTVPLLRAAADVQLAGLVVLVDRCERGADAASGETALEEVSREFAMPCFALITVHEVIEALHGREVDGRVVLDDEGRDRMRAYLEAHAPVQAG